MTALARDSQEGSLGNCQSRNSAFQKQKRGVHHLNVGGDREEGKDEVIKSSVGQRTDEFSLNLHFGVQSGTVPGTSRSMNVEKQEPMKDSSHNDPRAEVDAAVYRSAQSMVSDPE